MANDLGKSQSEVWKQPSDKVTKTEPIEEISQKSGIHGFLQVGTIMIIWLDDNLYALDKLHLIPFSYFLRKSHAAFAL